MRLTKARPRADPAPSSLHPPPVVLLARTHPARRRRSLPSACIHGGQRRERGCTWPNVSAAAPTSDECRSEQASVVDAPRSSRSTAPASVAMALTAFSDCCGQPAGAVGEGGAIATAAAMQGAAPGSVPGYVPGPVEVGWEVYVGAAACVAVFALGAWEFVKRILIQRRCEVCGGSGLVRRGAGQRKCPQCGGFFPWISWRQFLSANARPGNGGPLMQPKGQTSVLYRVPEKATVPAGSGDKSSDAAEGPRE